MPQSYKNKVQYTLTSPTSLEMLKNRHYAQNAALPLKARNRLLAIVDRSDQKWGHSTFQRNVQH